MMCLICLGPTMIWSTVSDRCATGNGAPRGGEEPLLRWWCVARCACSPLSPCNDSVFYREPWRLSIWRYGTACVSSSPFGVKRGANNCVSARIPQPTLRRWRRSCSRQACHPRFFLQIQWVGTGNPVLGAFPVRFESFEGSTHTFGGHLCGDDSLLETDLCGQFQGPHATISAKVVWTAMQEVL